MEARLIGGGGEEGWCERCKGWGCSGRTGRGTRSTLLHMAVRLRQATWRRLPASEAVASAAVLSSVGG